MDQPMRDWLERNVGELDGNVLHVRDEPDLLDEVLAVMENHLGRRPGPDDLKYVRKNLQRRAAARYS